MLFSKIWELPDGLFWHFFRKLLYKFGCFNEKVWSFLIFFFLSAMSLRRTSKDLNFLPSSSSSFFFETKSWQKHKFLSDSNKLANFNNTNKEFLPKKSSQKKSSQKSSQKIFPKNLPQKIEKNPKNTPLKSKKFANNFSKNS